jgi:membrane fusion protein, multidrug efflux system
MQKIVFFLLLLAVFSSCKKKETVSPGQGQGQGRRGGGPVTVEVTVIQPGMLQNIVQTTGTIIGNETVDLRPEVSGRVTGIFFNEGSIVEKGKLLLKVNDADLQAQLHRLEAQLKLLSDEEFRKRKLLEIKAVSQEEYDASLNQLMVSQAEKQLLQAQVAKTEIYAPFSGKIGLRSVSPGSYVVSNTIVASLQQVDPVKVEFDVPEKYSSLVKDGMDISFNLENSDTIFHGKVYARETSINPDTRTLKVRALAPNRQQLLMPGRFARVKLVLETFPEAITVPSEALVTDQAVTSVFVCKNNRARMTKVITGIRTDTEVQISEGIQPGDSLIVTGLMQLSKDAPVRPKPASFLK